LEPGLLDGDVEVEMESWKRTSSPADTWDTSEISVKNNIMKIKKYS
jgi:hypothetical protein